LFDDDSILTELPQVRDGLVLRRSLIRRLRDDRVRVVVATAPAGCGKTTLVRQWAEEDPRPVGWVTAVAASSDPVVLVRGIAQAIGRTLSDGPVAEVLPSLRGMDALRNLSRLCRAASLDGRPVLLVLDNVQELDDQRAHDVVALLVDRLPPSWTVAILTRSAVSLPVARWRADGIVVELGAADLALDSGECSEVLRELGVDRPSDVATYLVAQTEGWAAGVYLAGLALKSGHLPAGRPAVTGDVHVIRSYIETELLSGLDPEASDLLVRTSIVDAVNGPLADAILGRGGSAARLYDLAHDNQFVMPLDAERRWFRYHTLLRDVLARRHEDLTPGPSVAHERAAEWFRSAGRVGDAVEHELRAGNMDAAAELMGSILLATYRDGEIATIRRWTSALPTSTIAAHPNLAGIVAVFAAIEGDVLTAAHWSAVAERGWAAGTARTTPTDLDGTFVRALLCPSGPEAMLADAEHSLRTHDTDWQWRPPTLLLAGAARAMLGDVDGAGARYLEAEQAPDIGPAVARLVLRAERPLAAIGRRRWQEASAILALDRAAVEADPESGRTVGMLWVVADARVAIHRGDLRLAQDRLRRAQLLRTGLSWAVPWYAVRTLTELARTQLLLGDSQGALMSLVQARETLEIRPDLGMFADGVEEVTTLAMRVRSDGLPAGSTLTPAELRLLPLLQTYLSFREIGERLGVSGNTVKTEAMSIYSKVGATSRSEAVTSAVGYGLLEDIFA